MSALSASDQTAGLREAGLVPWSVTALGTGGPRLLGQPPSTARGTGQRQGAPKAEEAGRLGGERAHSSGGVFRFPAAETKVSPAPTPGTSVCVRGVAVAEPEPEGPEQGGVSPEPGELPSRNWTGEARPAQSPSLISPSEPRFALRRRSLRCTCAGT